MDNEYSIDFKGTPKHNPDDREKVKQLMVDCFKVFCKSVLLREEAERDMFTIISFCEQHKDQNPDDFSWEEREKMTTEATRLLEVWRASVKKLKELDDEYEEVRQRVNGYYGKEIMPKQKHPPGTEDIYKDILDEGGADWWKKI